MVASHAQDIGLRTYRQVPGESDDLCEPLRVLGMGQATAPAVFTELVMDVPPMSLAGLVALRIAAREIAADEKRHVDFPRFMPILSQAIGYFKRLQQGCLQKVLKDIILQVVCDILIALTHPFPPCTS